MNKSKEKKNPQENLSLDWKHILENLGLPAMILDEERNIVYLNEMSIKLLGQKKETILNSKCYELLHKDKKIPHNCPFELLYNTKTVSSDDMAVYIDSSDKIFYVTCTPLLIEDGLIKFVLHVAVDVTERIELQKKMNESIDDKNHLIKEIHHRMKNNMQLISSLLELQTTKIIEENDKYQFSQYKKRIRSIALVHELLYQSNDLTNIDAKTYIQSLVNYLIGVSENSKYIKIQMDIDTVLFSIDKAIPWGITMNELLSNSFKHAFPDNAQGRTLNFFGIDHPGNIQSPQIIIQLKKSENQIHVVVKDNGVGIPDSFNLQSPSSLGYKLVSNLTAQLNGKVIVDNKDGTLIHLTYPV